MAQDKTLSEDQIKKVLAGIRIPPQPQVLVDLQMEQVMPHPDLNRIAELISHDPGLAGTMLKVVNSAQFGLKNKITSPRQAVQLMGLNTVLNILNGIAIKSELADETIIQLGSFWDTTMDIAVTSAALARQLGLRGADEAYALGLFHNCGIPLLMKRFADYPEVMEESYRAEEGRVIDIENRHYNTNHAVVGFYVAKSWHLPELLCEIIAEHHNVVAIFLSSEGEYYDSYKKNLLAILKMAEHLCGNYQTLGGQTVDYEWERIGLPALHFLGLTQDDFDNIKDDFAGLGGRNGGFSDS